MPNKPETTIGHILFRTGQRPVLAVERLPTEKTALERRIVEKWVTAMSRRNRAITLKLPARNAPFDCLVSEGAEDYGVEITEVVSGRHAAIHARRADYATSIIDKLRPMLVQLAGFELHLSFEFGEKLWPKPQTPTGQEIVRSYIREIMKAIEEISKLGVWQAMQRIWNFNERRCCFWGVRCAPAESNVQPEIRADHSMSYFEGELDNLLIDAIRKKVDRYSRKTCATQVILLCYQVSGPAQVVGNDLDSLVGIRRYLRGLESPFKEIWYFWPMVTEHGGGIVPIWPASLELS